MAREVGVQALRRLRRRRHHHHHHHHQPRRESRRPRGCSPWGARWEATPLFLERGWRPPPAPAPRRRRRAPTEGAGRDRGVPGRSPPANRRRLMDPAGSRPSTGGWLHSRRRPSTAPRRRVGATQRGTPRRRHASQRAAPQPGRAAPTVRSLWAVRAGGRRGELAGKLGTPGDSSRWDGRSGDPAGALGGDPAVGPSGRPGGGPAPNRLASHPAVASMGESHRQWAAASPREVPRQWSVPRERPLGWAADRLGRRRPAHRRWVPPWVPPRASRR
ncbi:hypothetical protein I4F81_003751 [Pyropia yezoensis]|uniref:Uncharacterized protein n=1 Tax=Pyropia yezoensis TaxID=2788 RepID=A0ACC3BTE8_PYRYE|nr:hypothetical protein I4F81_003751 [Neopyropia yezoensis]